MTNQYTVGDIKTIAIPDPAAGANFAFTIPVGQRLIVHSVCLSLSSDATVIDRNVCLFVDDGGTVSFIQVSAAVQTASLITRYSFSPDNRNMTAIINDYITVSLSSKMVLKPGDVLNSDVHNLQAADQILDTFLLVESFLLP